MTEPYSKLQFLANSCAFDILLQYSCSNLYTCINFHKNLMKSRWENIHLALIGDRQWTATLLINYRWSKVTGFEYQYDSGRSFIGPKQACCGGPVVRAFSVFQAQPLWGGLYFRICLNPLEILIVVCIHVGICPVSISIFSSFFRKSFTMNHLVSFPEVKLESSVIAKLDPIR